MNNKKRDVLNGNNVPFDNVNTKNYVKYIDK